MTVVHLGESGIVLNEVDAFGVDWGGTGDENPWSPSPAPRSVTGQNATTHGGWDATEFYGSRTFALEGEALVPVGSESLLVQAEQRLKAAIGLRPFALRVVENGFDRWALFRRDSQLSWKVMTPTWAIFSVSIVAPKPEIYSTAMVTASTSFPSSTGGLTWPATWPATWDTDVVNGELALVNEGTETAWPVYRIDGPVVNPRIVNTVTGEQMTVSITLLAGEWLTVDTGSHQVLGNGDPAANRRNLFTGTFFGLEPGQNTIRFDGLSAGPGAALSTSYSHTWI